MTKRAGRSVSNDPGFQATLQAKAGAICLVAKAWDYHVRVALGITQRGEPDRASTQSVEGGGGDAGREAMIDCEHFFDGYKGNRAYALAVATHRLQGGRALGGAVRHQRRHAAARGRGDRRRGGRSTCRARTSASTPTTTPRTRSPIRWRPCAPARARSRARSTASASAAATPTSTSHHPDAAAEERVRRPLRDAGDAGALARS